MGEPIVNKVAKSPLINFDLEEWIPKGQRTLVDLSKWLEDGFLLREKPFREALKQEDCQYIKIIILPLTVLQTLFYPLGQLFW